ncbi:MAG: D-2-hydroxyacid dehydrogenase [Holophagaceae bacterium]|nr:D-2-hydroxyacid dehydrogenase [Holophagaceae bacterium]
MTLPRLAVVHHMAAEWVSALQAAESRLAVRGWHPREAVGADPDWLAQAEALFTWRFPDGFFAKMPALKWIQNAGAGVDHLLTHPELPPDVSITRADGRFGEWISRYVCGHLLYEVQKIEACHLAQSARQWQGKLLPERLHNKLALVVGFGRIGRHVGLALKVLGMEVHGFVTAGRSDSDFQIHAINHLPEFISMARALVICAPSTPVTEGMINASILSHGHPELTLINVGRGSQVVLPDVVDALNNGRLGRAVLDVFPTEPLNADSPLWNHPRLTITPHHSGPTVPEDLILDILPNLRAYAEGRPITNVVDRARGY